MEPAITVCIPTFNCAGFVRTAVNSVLGQTLPAAEVLIGDNASTDETWDVIAQIKDARVHCFRNERNLGIAGNFNRLVAQASGAYIKILCADDWLEPDCLRRQAQLLHAHPELAAVAGRRTIVNQAGELISGPGQKVGVLQVFDKPALIASALLRGNVLGEPSALLLRRDALLRAGAFDPGRPMLVDLEMWVRLAAFGKIALTGDIVCHVRRHPQSMTNTFRRQGKVQEDVARLTGEWLRETKASGFIRAIALGKVTGSYLRHALFGMASGQWDWPVQALGRACRSGSGVAGLAAYWLLFRSGLLQLAVDADGALRPAFGRMPPGTLGPGTRTGAPRSAKRWRVRGRISRKGGDSSSL
ncbi:MAG TPA: glycosyltransferase family 2 protein [Terriglobales bacterium]|nr:glycosyltransferase family 2 protein [Terriglobales bacterium]